MNAANLADLLRSMATLPTMGEAVDQYQHAMQTAAAAFANGADDDLVMASVLHDVGRSKLIASRYATLPHEEAGGEFVRALLGERAGWLVAAHVAAKRYLVRAQRSHALSARSQTTLLTQGGPMTDVEAERFAEHRWAPDALALRRWDDAAKVPGAPVPPLSDVLTVYERCRRKLR